MFYLCLTVVLILFCAAVVPLLITKPFIKRSLTRSASTPAAQ
jgi:hypothetical protein